MPVRAPPVLPPDEVVSNRTKLCAVLWKHVYSVYLSMIKAGALRTNVNILFMSQEEAEKYNVDDEAVKLTAHLMNIRTACYRAVSEDKYKYIYGNSIFYEFITKPRDVNGMLYKNANDFYMNTEIGRMFRRHLVASSVEIFKNLAEFTDAKIDDSSKKGDKKSTLGAKSLISKLMDKGSRTRLLTKLGEYTLKCVEVCVELRKKFVFLDLLTEIHPNQHKFSDLCVNTDHFLHEAVRNEKIFKTLELEDGKGMLKAEIDMLLSAVFIAKTHTKLEELRDIELTDVNGERDQSTRRLQGIAGVVGFVETPVFKNMLDVGGAAFASFLKEERARDDGHLKQLLEDVSDETIDTICKNIVYIIVFSMDTMSKLKR